ncbi:ComEC/Rec2 family competence protein [Salinibacterium sp. ZJ454]|uniref:ComEC/Rec2 family competence protein n=1 Tax=Salinibacterium sp. ZJ454 TaxID=2708339 RepID=UPI0014225BF9|nr:ComEC/Rec2 family competence protein [Salinibacterium sp. ZJ454]
MPDLRLAVPVVVAWAAAGLGIALEPPWPVAIALWLAAAGTLVVALVRRGGHASLVAVCLAAAALVTSAAAVQQPERRPAELAAMAADGRYLRATAAVTRVVGDRFEATLVGVNAPNGTTVAFGRVPVLVFHAIPDDAGIGSTLHLGGTMQPTPAGDDVSYLYFADRVTVAAAPPALLSTMNGLRAAFLGAATALPGPGGALLPGLAIGDTSAVPEQLDADMKTSALSHLTAVSGANCAIVIGLIMLLGGLLGVPRGWRVAASVVVLAGFVLLVTPEPSVLRAAVMALIVLVTLAVGRPVHGLPVLSAAVIVLLSIDPWLSRSYGFALSVLATGGLLLLSGPLAERLARWMPRPIAAIIAVPLAAQLACQPVLLLLEPSIPVYGVLANVLAGPAAPVTTVLGSLACVLLPLWPWLGAVLTHLAWLPATWIATVAERLAGLPAARLPWPEGAIGLGLLLLITAAALLALLTARWRRPAALLVAVLVVGTLGGTTGARLLQRAGQPQHWQIAVCDVGQGDAVLVRSGAATALIDTGPDPALLTACLDQLGIARVSLLVLTHFDLDHVGGAAAMIGRADHALIGPPDAAEDHALLADIQRGGAPLQAAAAGQHGRLGELRWRVLWPTGAVEEPGNDASVTVSFDGVGDCANGCLSSLFLGDLGATAQARLLAAGGIEPVDVVKVSHHGSADQHPELYARARAALGVIGVGADNGYGHPADDLLSLLQRTGTAVARTDRSGLLLISPTSVPGTVELWTERAAPDDSPTE